MKSQSMFPYVLAGAAGALVNGILPVFSGSSQAETKLLPFQGRLTDAAGVAIADGAKVVEFKMYDAPTGGSVKWAGEVHKLSVNGGLVNTLLGSKAGLGGVDFATPSYLQITIDADSDGQITAADPPLLPRQSVVGAIFSSEAGNSRKLNNADWTAVLTGADPVTSVLRADKIAPASLTTVHLAPLSVKGPQIDASAITSTHIADESVQKSDLSAALQQSLVPTGTVLPYLADDVTTPPPGWEFCYGQNVLKADPKYAALFARIGINHGSADSLRFNLPDYRGRFLRGIALGPENSEPHMRDRDRGARQPMNPGGAGGTSIGSVQGDALQNITGRVATSYAVVRDSTDGGALQDSTFSGGTPRTSPSFSSQATSGSIDFDASKSPGARTSSETRPKNAYVNYIIKL